MRKGLMVLLLVLVACEFVVAGSSSEIKMNFVVMGLSGDVENGLSFLEMYGDYLVAGLIVLVVVVIYLNAIRGQKKSKRKRGKKRRK